MIHKLFLYLNMGFCWCLILILDHHSKSFCPTKYAFFFCYTCINLLATQRFVSYLQTCSTKLHVVGIPAPSDLPSTSILSPPVSHSFLINPTRRGASYIWFSITFMIYLMFDDRDHLSLKSLERDRCIRYPGVVKGTLEYLYNQIIYHTINYSDQIIMK